MNEDETYEEQAYEKPVYEEPAAPAPDLNGLAYNASVFRDEGVNMYGVTAYGLRSGDGGDHGSGLAVDFMVPVGSDIGDEIAAYAINNMAHTIFLASSGNNRFMTAGPVSGNGWLTVEAILPIIMTTSTFHLIKILTPLRFVKGGRRTEYDRKSST